MNDIEADLQLSFITVIYCPMVVFFSVEYDLFTLGNENRLSAYGIVGMIITRLYINRCSEYCRNHYKN